MIRTYKKIIQTIPRGWVENSEDDKFFLNLNYDVNKRAEISISGQELIELAQGLVDFVEEIKNK